MRNAGALLARPTPARPGPGPMAEGLLRALDVSIGRRVEGLLAGDFRSNLLGTGTELAMMRPYVPGDDVRRIDWNVTARTGEPHVRVDLAERVLVTWLVLDTSVSMQFGTADRRKADVAEGVAVAIGHLATRRGNRLGVVTFGGEESPRDPTAAGARRPRRAARRASQRAAGGRARARRTLAAALARTGALARQRSLVVVVSDFRGRRATGDAPLLELAGHHDVVAVEIRDPREQELSNVGLLYLVDPETGRQLRVDTRSRRLRERFAVAAAAERAELARSLAVGRRPARRAHDVRRLAPPARRRSCAGAARELRLAARARRARRRSRSSSRSTSTAIAGASRRRRSSGTPISCRTSSIASPGRLRYLPPLILLVALVFLIVGVARPHATVSVPREEATIVLAMDVSRSMKATDVEPTRLDAARVAAKTFLDEVPEKFRVGVVSFATRAAVGVAPTEDRALVDAALDTLKPGEGTAIGDAVALSLQVGQPQERERGSAAARDRAHLRRRAGRRPDRAGRGRAAGEAARRARLHGARRHARRRRRGGADRRLQADHAVPPESGDARAGRRRRRAASSSPRPTPKG